MFVFDTLFVRFRNMGMYAKTNIFAANFIFLANVWSVISLPVYRASAFQQHHLTSRQERHYPN
jgi:hypothetical protein